MHNVKNVIGLGRMCEIWRCKIPEKTFVVCSLEQGDLDVSVHSVAT